MHRHFAAVLAGLIATSPQAQERPLPEAQSFLQSVRQHLETDDQRQSGYMYVETRREEKLDKDGRSTGKSVKVFESYPALPGETRWNRLIAENGRPIPPTELEKADRDRRKHVEDYAQKVAKDPAKERARLDRDRDREWRERTAAIDDIFRVFDIRMIGRESVEGHDTIVFTLMPRPGVKARTREGDIMRSFAVRAWISESDYELVRLDVEAVDTLSFGFGLLARVHKGSRGSFQRRKVNGEAWLPAVATFTGSARVGLVKTIRRGGTLEFSNYKKFNVETTATYTPR